MRQEFSFYYAAIPDSNKKAEKGSKIQLISCSLSGELPLCNLDAAFFFVVFVFEVCVLFFLHRFLFAVRLCIWLCCVSLQRV